LVVEKLRNNRLSVTVFLIYTGVFLLAPAKGLQSINNSFYYLLEMMQVLPVVFILTTVIDAWIPKETILRKFGKNSGFGGNILALALGSMSAGPIYAAFPISKMLLEKGASVSNVVIIISAWAVVKVPMLVLEVNFLSFDFMVVRWILTVFGIFIMASLTAKMVKHSDLPGTKAQVDQTVIIKDDYCTGCGVCAAVSPIYFAMSAQKAYVKEQVEDFGSTEFKKVQTAEKKCPANAILVKK